MLSFLPSLLKGSLVFFLYAFNTISLCVVLFVTALLKFIIPIHSITILFDKVLIAIATFWISINSCTTDLFCKIEWDIRGIEQLK
ncbi:MAG: acyltransferase, partial [Desulfobacteraceae bacterium]|nr:acyltransferase [Desulfobacteraceae bacterium]